jgi:hypothetical protein
MDTCTLVDATDAVRATAILLGAAAASWDSGD